MDNQKISGSELQALLDAGEKVFILDVRPVEQRREWRIAESVHLDAYAQLNSGDLTVLNDMNFPNGVPVVTVCAAGKTSLIASEALRKKGIKARSLDGGMKSWNYAWNRAGVTLPSGLKVIQVRRPAKGVLSYIAGSAGEAIVIDAALDPAVYTALAAENRWTIKYVMDTHVHADYISRTRELANATGAAHLLTDKAQVDFRFTPVESGAFIRFGKASAQFIHTPGHTWESTSFYVADEVVFTGDTLFIDSIGRPDLKASEQEVVDKAKSLYGSLKRLAALPPKALVLPAHTADAIPFDNILIGQPIARVFERVKATEMREAEFVEVVMGRIPAAPPNYLTIAALNRKGSYEGHQLADLEAGGNHCAIA